MAKALIHRLRSQPESKYGDILKDYLGSSYGPHFTDWLVFIGKDGLVKQALTHEGRFHKGNLIRGGQSFFAVVFSETPLQVPKPPSAKPDAGDGDASKSIDSTLEFSRATLQYTREPTLTAFIKSVSKGIIGDPGQSAPVPDSVISLPLLDVNLSAAQKDTAANRLYVALRRLALPNNALVRFTLRPHQPGKSYDLPTTTSITRTIENASPNRFGASLGLGVTVDAPDSSFALSGDSTRRIVKSKSSRLKPNIWLLAHFYVVRPQLPIRSRSFSVIAGSNIGVADLFRDLLIGLSVDRVFGDVGLMGGLNFLERQTSDVADSTASGTVALETHTYRKAKGFVGINFAF